MRKCVNGQPWCRWTQADSWLVATALDIVTSVHWPTPRNQILARWLQTGKPVLSSFSCQCSTAKVNLPWKFSLIDFWSFNNKCSVYLTWHDVMLLLSKEKQIISFSHNSEHRDCITVVWMQKLFQHYVYTVLQLMWKLLIWYDHNRHPHYMHFESAKSVLSAM